MSTSVFHLSCRACSWRADWDGATLDARIRGADSSPANPSALRELLTGGAEPLVCPECGVPGVAVEPAVRDDDWQDVVVCEICRKPIPPERLDAVPGVRRCASCQSDDESGRLADETEYCPKCGALMTLRARQSAGITRYRLFCAGSPPCR